MDIRTLGMPRPPFVAALAAVLIFSGLVLAEDLGLIRLPGPSNELTASVLPGAVIALTNDNRVGNGLPNLTASPLLNEAAQLKANDMAAKSYYAHTSPDGTIPPAWLTKVGYQYTIMGENLVIDRTTSDEVVSAWMGSTDHRENILNPQFTEIGVGVAEGVFEGRQTIYVVEELAHPGGRTASASPKPIVVAPAANPTAPAPKPVPSVVAPVVKVPTIPAPLPTKTAATTAVLVKAPTPKPAVHDTLSPILTTIASSTFAEVPQLVASTTYEQPALASHTGPVVELTPQIATTTPAPVPPHFSTAVHAWAKAFRAELRAFFTF